MNNLLLCLDKKTADELIYYGCKLIDTIEQSNGNDYYVLIDNLPKDFNLTLYSGKVFNKMNKLMF